MLLHPSYEQHAASFKSLEGSATCVIRQINIPKSLEGSPTLQAGCDATRPDAALLCESRGTR